MYPQPASDAEPLRPAAPTRAPSDDDEFGVECHLCRSRMYVRRRQIGQTVKCPDCHSPVVVKTPSKRVVFLPEEYDEADLYKMSAPPEMPSAIYMPPDTRTGEAAPGAPPAAGTPDGAGKPAGGATAMQAAAQAMLEKARVQQEKEEADEREHSAERFTDGLLAFLADPQALVRLGLLAVWFEGAMALLRWVFRMTIAKDDSAVLGEAAGWAATVALASLGISFLVAVAACGWALVSDSSDGLRKIQNWPGINVFRWGRGMFYILNAGLLTALPGVAFGILLGMVGIKGSILFTAAATFVGFFPPTLLSMLESNSVFVPVNNDVWVSIRERPDPWKLTYLITLVVTIAGLFGFYFSLIGSFLGGTLAAAVMVACMLIYFRTVGWLVRFLAGEDGK